MMDPGLAQCAPKPVTGSGVLGQVPPVLRAPERAEGRFPRILEATHVLRKSITASRYSTHGTRQAARHKENTMSYPPRMEPAYVPHKKRLAFESVKPVQ